MSRSYPFVQGIRVGGGYDEILPDHVLRCSLIETGDMSGTKLIIDISDKNGFYRDDLGIKNGIELELTYGDPHGRGDDVFIDTFVVMPPVSRDGVLMLEGFQVDCYQLKQPAKAPEFFVNQTPRQVLNKLIPNAKVDCDQFNQLGTYHLNAGASKSRLIRTMARDFGAMAFYSRGTFYFKRFAGLMQRDPELRFEHNNPGAEVSMHSCKLSDQTFMYERVLNRKYVQWDTVEGLVTSSGEPENGTVMISSASTATLDFQGDAIIPIMTAETLGNSSFMPSMLVSVTLNMNDPEKVIDETVPDRQVINQVTHHQRGSAYLCRVELGVVNE